MRNKMVLALILLGAVAIPAASMPQRTSLRSIVLDPPKCTCSVSINGNKYYGIYDRENEICDLDVECKVDDE